MSRIPSIAIYDIGKTNKKVFLFDESYRIIWEDSTQLEETTDEDGFPCEDLKALENWIRKSFDLASSLDGVEIRALNFSGYGASFVNLGKDNRPITPLYNYLKPFPQAIEQSFYSKYGGPEKFARVTASPRLGNLNSGLQLLRLRMEKPAFFHQILHALHLPQWLSFLFTNQFVSDMTSIGCHTAMWNFKEKKYHEWLEKERILQVLAPISPSEKTFKIVKSGKELISGIGLHDSSAALTPYLLQSKESFLLISTGTWSISLNPFNRLELTQEELSNDCLCYLDFKGNQVKASRLFAGQLHDQLVLQLAEHFQVSEKYFQQLIFDSRWCLSLDNPDFDNSFLPAGEILNSFNPDRYKTPEEGYHQLMTALILLQKKSTEFILGKGNVKSIFVDGGFSKNSVFMNLLALVFKKYRVYAARVAQASAIGAAMAIHEAWNKTPLVENLVSLQSFSRDAAS